MHRQHAQTRPRTSIAAAFITPRARSPQIAGTVTIQVTSSAFQSTPVRRPTFDCACFLKCSRTLAKTVVAGSARSFSARKWIRAFPVLCIRRGRRRMFVKISTDRNKLFGICFFSVCVCVRVCACVRASMCVCVTAACVCRHARVFIRGCSCLLMTLRRSRILWQTNIRFAWCN